MSEETVNTIIALVNAGLLVTNAWFASRNHENARKNLINAESNALWAQIRATEHATSDGCTGGFHAAERHSAAKGDADAKR